MTDSLFVFSAFAAAHAGVMATKTTFAQNKVKGYRREESGRDARARKREGFSLAHATPHNTPSPFRSCTFFTLVFPPVQTNGGHLLLPCFSKRHSETESSGINSSDGRGEITS